MGDYVQTIKRLLHTLGTGAETSLLLKLHSSLNSPYPIHAADGYYTRVSSCKTLLWLHHDHKTSVSYHENVLVSSLQAVGRWFVF